MNKHMKIIVSALFIVIIILAVAITRFYSDTTKTTVGDNTQTDIDRKHGTDIFGNRIFEDSRGLYGIIDSRERVIVAPEWLDLRFIGNGRCIAKTQLGGSQLMGCIDYEGNIVVPLIYKSINEQKHSGYLFYTAQTASDDSWVVYDESFNSFFSSSWNECKIDGDTMTLTGRNGTYTYNLGSEGLVFTGAVVSGEALGRSFTVSARSRSLLSKLTPAMLEQIVDSTGHYLEFAYTGKTEYIAGIRTGAQPAITMLFPGEMRIKERRLVGIEDIFVYSQRSEDDIPRFAVSVTAVTELDYVGDDGKDDVLRESYKAEVCFSGDSESSLKAVSGGFLSEKPDFPKTGENDDKKPESDSPANNNNNNSNNNNLH